MPSQPPAAPEAPGLDDPDDVADTIQAFLGRHVGAANANGVVVNLSGGIDSTTAATLAVEALGNAAVEGLVLPASATPDGDVDDAIRVAERLAIDYRVIDVQPIVDAFVGQLGSDHASGSAVETDPSDPESDDDRRAAIGNVAARARMTVAYFEANRADRLVVGTGNRSELLLGYFTKYGDGGVDLLPIGDLYKTQVRDLATELGVAESIVRKEPTAGLWEGQSDADEIGAPYETVDAILRLAVDRGVGSAAIADVVDRPMDFVDELLARVDATAHKRRQPPTPGLR
ncbi:MAG: NAD+ synthase [Halanaeroarchaeum sp.]